MNRKPRGPRREDEGDQFRTLDGQRGRSVRDAKELAEYLEKKPELEKQKQAKKRAKLESIVNAANDGWNSRQKFNDEELLEQSEELVSDVRQAVLSTNPLTNDPKGKGKAKMDTFFEQDYSDDDSEED